MKYLRILIILTFAFSGITVQAQQTFKDYFVGKWDVDVFNTPKGNQKMIIELKRVGDKLQGAIVGPTDDIKKFTNIRESANAVDLTFKYMIFNVHLVLQKKDDNNVIGKLQDDYKALGKRIK